MRFHMASSEFRYHVSFPPPSNKHPLFQLFSIIHSHAHSRSRQYIHLLLLLPLLFNLRNTLYTRPLHLCALHFALFIFASSIRHLHTPPPNLAPPNMLPRFHRSIKRFCLRILAPSSLASFLSQNILEIFAKPPSHPKSICKTLP